MVMTIHAAAGAWMWCGYAVSPEAEHWQINTLVVTKVKLSVVIHIAGVYCGSLVISICLWERDSFSHSVSESERLTH